MQGLKRWLGSHRLLVTEPSNTDRSLAHRTGVALGALGLLAAAESANTLWRTGVLTAAGLPAYRGVWILIPHVFLYSTIPAAVAWLGWTGMSRRGWCAPPSLGYSSGAIRAGCVVGLVSVALTFLAAAGLQGVQAFRTPRIDLWLVTANVFSNAAEELIYRGFVLAALTPLLGPLLAAMGSGVLFGLAHTQYPPVQQAFVGFLGFLWCLAAIRTRGLVAPWVAHTLLDWIVDPVLG